jgi:hypothetical protein
VWTGEWWLSRRFAEACGCITSPEVIVRTETQKAVGGYDSRLPHSGDLEMWLRLAGAGDVGYLRGVDQAYYRLHQQSMSKAVYGGCVDDLVQRREAFDAAATHLSSTGRDVSALQQSAYEKLAREALWRAVRLYDRGAVDGPVVCALEHFAKETWSDAESSREYRALRLRRALGGKARALGPLSPGAYVRRGREMLWWASWKRRGV